MRISAVGLRHRLHGVRLVSFAISVTCAALLLAGAVGTASSSARSASATTSAVEQVPSAALQALQWRNIGPLRAGRSLAVAGSPSRPDEYYAGAVGGGLWKTTDGGASWQAVSDPYFTSSSVGAVAVCQANPDVVYAGMGEADFRNGVLQGDGIYKSTDDGKTWTHMGLDDSQVIARIVIDPSNCDRVYAAALGHTFGPNTQRGVFRSTDGGQTWQRVLYRNPDTGAVDVSMDPNHPSVLYAALWHAYMRPWGGQDAGSGDGLYKSTDGGDSWTDLTGNPGLPAGLVGKIGVSVSPVDSNRVYTIFEAKQGSGVYVSDDAGATWQATDTVQNLTDSDLTNNPHYYAHIFADPQQRDTSYALGDDLLKSTDGGHTYASIGRASHSDQHDLWIDPTNDQRIANANDGGADVTVNGGATWTAERYSTAQMYHVTTTNDVPYLVCGSQQDSGSACVSSQGDGTVLFSPGGGESGYIAVDPRDSNVLYAGLYGGTITRYDRRLSFEARRIDPWPVVPFGMAASDLKERFPWTYPIVTTPTRPKVVYTASQHVLRTSNGGQSWTQISPDLTRADPATLQLPFGPIYFHPNSEYTYATITSVAPSPLTRQVIWAGSDDGLVHVTRNGGGTWQNVTPRGVQPFTRISMIDASPHDPATAYVAANRYELDDRTPYMYVTHNYGRSWQRITDGIAANDYAYVVREDPVRRGLLYAGTENGVYVSFDDGSHWQPLSQNLPDTSVQDMVVKGNSLVIATFGRGFYIMDDVSPLRQITPQVMSDPTHLFQPSPTRMSEDRGVTVTYELRRPARHASVAFFDPRGRRVGVVANAPASAGMHRLVWKPTSHQATFTVRLSAGGRTESRKAIVVPGPRRTIPPARATAKSAAATSRPAAQSDQAFQLFKPANAVRLVDRNVTVNYEIDQPATSATLTFLDSHGRTIVSFSGNQVPTTPGPHQFLWNMRYPGPVVFPGLHMVDANPANGPRAPWGTYSVRLTVDNSSQTQSFQIDGASGLRDVTQHDILDEFKLGMNVVNRTSDADNGVIASRACRAQVDSRIQQASSPDVSSAGERLDTDLTDIENTLTSQNPPPGVSWEGVNPLELNEQIQQLLTVIESADSRPTDQDYAVFTVLSAQLTQRLDDLETVFGQPVAQFNALLSQHNLAPISCSL